MIDLTTILPGDPRVVHRAEDTLLICAKWQDVIGDLPTVDAVITDPPYSARVDAGYMAGHGGFGTATKEAIGYGSLSEQDALSLSGWVCGKSGARWFVAFSDHIGWQWLERGCRERGWYTFAPVIWVKRGSAPRFAGDGPSTACEH
ncbi:MAG: hypothetical protein VW362_11000, partial [Candidatus Nanopelagicales bacterium]